MKVTFMVRVNLVNCKTEETIDILEVTGMSQDDWDDMTEDEQNKTIQEIGEQWVWDNIEWGWE